MTDVAARPISVDADLPDLAEVVPHREAAEAFVTRICFKLGPPRLYGVELEWLVNDAQRPAAHVDRDRLAGALGSLAPAPLLAPPTAGRAAPLTGDGPSGPSLPRGGSLSVEPGGQIELSTAPLPSLAECLDAGLSDSRHLLDLLVAAGLTAADRAVDAVRAPHRILHTPRYDAMEAQFDRTGLAGRMMMCSTAAVQPCLDPGAEDEVAERWRTLYDIGPALVAVFANGSVVAGRRTPFRSARLAAWQAIDPSRTRPPGGGDDPRGTYARYALDADVLFVRQPGRWQTPAGVTFADWLGGALSRRPTYGDLAQHLTTLFPPVRAHGHLEVRYLDAQPGDGWVVPAAVVWALLSTPAVADRARAAAEATAGRWASAARHGLDDIDLARAGLALLGIALDALTGQPDWIGERVMGFADRYTLRGRCPGDDGSGS